MDGVLLWDPLLKALEHSRNDICSFKQYKTIEMVLCLDIKNKVH